MQTEVDGPLKQLFLSLSIYWKKKKNQHWTFKTELQADQKPLKTPRLCQQYVFFCVNSKCSIINPNNSSSNGSDARKTSNERSKGLS